MNKKHYCNDCQTEILRSSGSHKFCDKCSNRRNSESKKKFYVTIKSEQIKRKRRLCLGVLCRGEKEFTSIFGHRLCHKCRNAIKNYE